MVIGLMIGFVLTTTLVFEITIRLIQCLIIDRLVFSGLKQQIAIVRFQDRNAMEIKSIDHRQIFDRFFLISAMIQDLFYAHKLIEECPIELRLTDRALERIIRRCDPFLEARFMDFNAALTLAAFRGHKDAVFFEANVARHGGVLGGVLGVVAWLIQRMIDPSIFSRGRVPYKKKGWGLPFFFVFIVMVWIFIGVCNYLLFLTTLRM